MHRIDRVVIADERDPDSEGMHLARRYNVQRAPFFLVSGKDGMTEVHTVFFRFLKEVLRKPQTQREQIRELEELGAEVDFI